METFRSLREAATEIQKSLRAEASALLRKNGYKQHTNYVVILDGCCHNEIVLVFFDPESRARISDEEAEKILNILNTKFEAYGDWDSFSIRYREN